MNAKDKLKLNALIQKFEADNEMYWDMLESFSNKDGVDSERVNIVRARWATTNDTLSALKAFRNNSV
ncbi:MAG: hypothetical protein R6U15_06515 [Candidatus Izemoplasmatales bacterium]